MIKLFKRTLIVFYNTSSKNTLHNYILTLCALRKKQNINTNKKITVKLQV